MAEATDGYMPQHNLTVRQENAIDLLVTGQTDAQVAEAVGVNRVTVTKWRNYHPAFQAELNRRRQNLWGGAAQRLQSMLPNALDVIESELEQGDNAYRAAVQVVKLAGLEAAGPPTGPTDVQEIVDQLVEAKAKEKRAKRDRYKTSDDLIREMSDTSHLKAQDEALAEAVRREVLAEIEALNAED